MACPASTRLRRHVPGCPAGGPPAPAGGRDCPGLSCLGPGAVPPDSRPRRPVSAAVSAWA